MKKSFAILTLSALLAACSSTSVRSNSNADISGSQATASDNASTACRLLKDNGGHGKNKVYRCDIAAVLRTADAQSAIDNNISISYASGGGEYRTNATARSFGRDDSLSCERAVLNGVVNLQARVKKNGGRRLLNVVSYRAGNNGHFEQNFLSAGQADCIVATFQSRAVLRGTTGR